MKYYRVDRRNKGGEWEERARYKDKRKANAEIKYLRLLAKRNVNLLFTLCRLVLCTEKRVNAKWPPV